MAKFFRESSLQFSALIKEPNATTEEIADDLRHKVGNEHSSKYFIF